MCGRYTITHTGDLLEELGIAGGGEGTDVPPRYNVSPSQAVPAVRADDDGGRELEFLHWGLIPFWAKDKKIGYKMINARAETVADKPAFRNALKRRRCVILTDGFYEWKKVEGGKQPIHIQMKDKRPFTFAGLWERWDKGDEPIESCTILTTRANEAVAEVHDRMPVILDGEARDLWLDPQVDDAALLTPYLQPYNADAFAFTPVSRLVNNPRNDVPECVAPIETS